MPLGTFLTFLTFLAFLTRKLLRGTRANQKRSPEIRREALGRWLDAEQTRSLLDGLIRAGRPRHPSVAGQPTAFFWGANDRKVRKVRKGCAA
jgi:hypothetical protein